MNSLLFLLATYSNNAYSSDLHMNYDAYDHDNYWKMTPEVIICKSQTVFTASQIKYALDVWGEQYTKISIKEKCNYDIEYGKIKIIDGKHLKTEKHWGHTVYIYAEKTINKKIVREYDSALVQLDRNVTDVNLLIHELGHAFGYRHYNNKQDVMNEYGDYNLTGDYPY